MTRPRIRGTRHLLASLVGAALLAAPALAAELYLTGDIGISSVDADGDGFNTLLGLANSGNSNDASPVYGGALGIVFPLDAAVPWGVRIPGFAVPYWPGRRLRFHGSEDFRLPDWDVRIDVEYLRGRHVDLATQSFNALEPYRSSVRSWSLMGKLRLDIPVRRAVNAAFGRVPILDPLTLNLGGGAGMGQTELDAAGPGPVFGSKQTTEFAWQALAGFGYRLNERVTWSVGWRFQDLGEVKTRLVDAALTDRGSYATALQAHEFTTSLSFEFWHVPFLGDE